MVVKARPAFSYITGKVACAGTELEGFAKGVQGIFDNASAVRAEIFAAVFFCFTCKYKPGICFFEGKADIRILFAVLLKNVIIGFVFFYKVTFKYKGFPLGIGHNIFKIVNSLNHTDYLGGMGGVVREILTDTVFKAF